MIKSFLKPILILIPIIFLQLVVVPLISFSGIAPNLILLILIYFTLLTGQIYGTILGFIFGILFDLLSGGLLGASMLSMTIAGFIAGYFYNENKIDTNTTTFFFVIIVFLCSAVESFIFNSISNSNPDVTFFLILINGSLLPALYTSVLSSLVLVFTKRKVNQ